MADDLSGVTTPPPEDDPTPVNFEKPRSEEEEEEKEEEHPIRDEAADGGIDAAAGTVDGVGDAAEAVGRGSCDGWDGCGGCDCNLLLRVSTLLSIAAMLVPPRGGRAAQSVVVALLHGYRRWLTRFTPRCPSTPSCSAFALAAVESMGPRRGLAAAARRVRDCR